MSELSEQAKKIKSSLVRDSLDNTPIEDKRLAWEESARLVETSEHIVLKKTCIHDDSIRLAAKIKKSIGVVKLIEAQGLWHVWPTWGDFPEAQLSTQDIVKHIEKYR